MQAALAVVRRLFGGNHPSIADRARVAILERSEARLRLAAQLTGVGYWRRELTGRTEWSDETYVLHGLPKATHRERLGDELSLYLAEDQERIRRAVGRTLRDGLPFELDVRLNRASTGELRSLRYRGEAERDDTGAITAIFGVVRDITDEVAATARLQESEARYRLIADHAHDLIIRANMAGRVTYVSPSCRQLGYEPDEMLGMDGAELVHPDDLARFQDNTRQMLVDGRVDTARDRTHRIRRRDGDYVWLEGNPTIIRDETGTPRELLNVFRDVTERRRTEDALAAKDAELQALTDHAPDLLVKIDNQDRITYASPASRRFGWEPEVLTGKLRSEIVHPEDLVRLARALKETMAGKPRSNEDRQYRIRRGDGGWCWVEGSLVLVHDATGAPVAGVSLLRDISERRAAAAALAESEARYRLLTDNMTDVVACYGRDGVFTFLSPAIQELLGYTTEDLVGRQITDFLHPDDVAPSRRHFAAHLAAGPGAEPFRFEYRVRRKDGEWTWLEAHPRAIYDEGGAFVEWQDVVRDVSERKALEAQLRDAQAAAEATAQTKADFLANMSHELRTPLTSVVGFTKLVAEQPDLAPLTRNYVDRVSDASRALLCAVNDILDFSKLEAGQLSFRPEAVNVERLCRSALELFQPQAGAKDLTLTFESDVPAGQTVLLDPDRTRQVLLNLIGNAVKFTQAGSVTLRVTYADAALRVEVEDTGPGIPPDRLEQLFKRFSQVDGAHTRGQAGTGLGLAICKGIVEGQGGEVGVASEPGQGSVFGFWVPAPEAGGATAAPHGEASLAAGLEGVRVLVVDDHAANRELVQLFLAGVGAEVTEATDGEAAAELASEWPFDVILMDIRMPRLDGPGALKRIRSQPGVNDRTPILAFTADAEPAAAREFAAQGFDGIVSKPVSPAALIAAVSEATDFLAMVDEPEAASA